MTARIVAVLLLFLFLLPLCLTGCGGGKDSEITSIKYENGTLIVKGKIGGDVFAGKKGEIYLFRSRSGEISDGEPLAKTVSGGGFEFKVDCSDKPYLEYCGFVVAAMSGDMQYVALTSPAFTKALDTGAGKSYKIEPATKKGIVTNSISEAVDLGCGNAVYEADIVALLSGGEITFEYGGREVGFSGSEVRALDDAYAFAAAQNIRIILNPVLISDGTESSYLPSGAPEGSYCAPFFDNDEGAFYYCAAIAFLAQRYGAETEYVIVGKGADLTGERNYGISRTSAAAAGNAYLAARINYMLFYAENGDVKIYIPFSHDYSDAKGDSVGSKATFSKISELSAVDNFPWGAAFDLSPSSESVKDVTSDEPCSDNESTKYISVKNLSVLKDFMSEDGNRYDKAPRDLMIGGFSLTMPFAEDNSTAHASLTYAYLTAENDSDIDAFIYSSIVDGAEKNGLKSISDSGVTSEKPAYATFKFMDSDSSDGISVSESIISQSESVLGYNMSEKFPEINKKNLAKHYFYEEIVSAETKGKKANRIGENDFEKNAILSGGAQSIETQNDGFRIIVNADSELSSLSFVSGGGVVKEGQKVNTLSFTVNSEGGENGAREIIVMVSCGGGKCIYEGEAVVTTGADTPLSFDLRDFIREAGSETDSVTIAVKPVSGNNNFIIKDFALSASGGSVGFAGAFIVALLMIALLLYIVFSGGMKNGVFGFFREKPDEREERLHRRGGNEQNGNRPHAQSQ